MPGKKVQCSFCSKVMRSDNLKKHVKIHKKAVLDSQPLVITGQKRQHYIDNVPTTDKGDFNIAKSENLSSQSKNPKIQALLNEVVNDGLHTKIVKENPHVPVVKRIKLSTFENDKVFNDTEGTRTLVDHDDDDADQSDEGSVDISNISPPYKVKFLPETVDGLRVRFEELLKNIAVDRKSGAYEKLGIEMRLCSCWMN